MKRVESMSRRWRVFALLAGTGILGFMLSLFLLGRVPMVTIPALIGFPMETAILRLDSLGLRIESTRVAAGLSDEPDTVLEMDPPPGNQVRKNRVIHLLVAEEAELGHVPNVIGLQRDKVAERLSKAGLKIGVQTGLSWPNIEADIVFAQDPRPETTPTDNRHVNLLVSRDPPPKKYRMPSLLFGPVEPVLDAVAEAGLRAKIVPVITEAYDSDLIIGQKPLAGYPILEGEELTFENTLIALEESDVLQPNGTRTRARQPHARNLFITYEPIRPRSLSQSQRLCIKPISPFAGLDDFRMVIKVHI